MLILKCKMCGGSLELIDDKSTAECLHCGTVQTLPSADNEKKIRLFNQANKLRMSCEFDRAASLYENIIAEFPEEAEGYWGICLCNYGIEYVDDPATGEKKPTCHRASFEKLNEDENFKNALDYADMLAKRQYLLEAREIDRINEEILSVSKNEKPYDIFICYKELDENKERTVDSLMAENLYDILTDKGYKVFFARISLEDKIGMQYEPYIFAALNSAKMMLCVGTQFEYFHAVWVQNEWSRFLRLAAKDKSKVLIPCYKDCDPYLDLPQEFKALQAQDLGKVGADKDLLRGIEKILGKKQEEAPAQKQVVVNTATGATTETFLKRAKLALESGDFNSANKFCESALNMAPENADAYLYKLLADMKITSVDALSKGTKEFTDNVNYQRAYRFGDQKRKEWLKFCADSIVYNIATDAMVSADSSKAFEKAANIFKRIPAFQDASVQIEKCLQFKELAEYEEEEERKEKIYQAALKKKNDADNTSQLKEAINEFEKIPDYKDVKQQISECASTANGWYYDGITRKNKIISINKKVRTLARIELVLFLYLIGFIVYTFVSMAFLNNASLNLFVAYLTGGALVVTFITAFATSFVDSKYDASKDRLNDRGSIFEGFLGLIFFFKTFFISFGKKDIIKSAGKDIVSFEEQISLLNPKILQKNDAKKEETKKNVRKIKNAHRRFNFRILLLLIVVFIACYIPAVIIPGIMLDKATQLYEEGNYDAAYDIADSLHSDEAVLLTRKIITARQISELNNVNTGDIIKFGVAEIKNSSPKEREWLVLDVVGNKALIIENTCFEDARVFDGDTWEESGIREYLNGDFLTANMSEEQIDMILLSNVLTLDEHRESELTKDFSTEDKVFLLSKDEFNLYFPDEEDQKYSNRSWWLRTHNSENEGVVFFNSRGYLDCASEEESATIRAAMWIDISNID